MQTKVFIVDDHYLVIEGIRSLLHTDNSIEWIGHAMTAASCLAFLKQQQPDVLLMDVNLPDKSGIELCKEVRTLYPSVFVLGLSTFNEYSFVKKMMNNGASGYLLKNATKQELLEGINAAVKGKLYLSGEAAQTLQQRKNDEGPVLTQRELEVLNLIGEGLTANEIAQKLFISTNTVDTHRKNLFTKFNAKNTALLIRLATQMKFIG
jgi:DNA-binding NarL/FixJ family response regulator